MPSENHPIIICLHHRPTSRSLQQQQQQLSWRRLVLYADRTKHSHKNSNTNVDGKEQRQGTVIRVAYRSFKDKDSKPSGTNYTTRKDAVVDQVMVTAQGVQQDYNHYRTVALKSTPDRAVSLWTTDVLHWLHSYSYYQDIQIGDFGENISVDGVNYTFFQKGQQYQFQSAIIDRTSSREEANVILEITERMEPCANLCKLPYINQPDLSPKERIQKCKNFLEVLDRDDGLRGWYAKVIQEGRIGTGDRVVPLFK